MNTTLPRLLLISVGCALLAGCASDSTGQRVDTLETGQQVADLRLSHVENRLTLVEQDLGKLQEPVVLDKKGNPIKPKPVVTQVATASQGVPVSPAASSSSVAQPKAAPSPVPVAPQPKESTSKGIASNESAASLSPVNSASTVPSRESGGQPVAVATSGKGQSPAFPLTPEATHPYADVANQSFPKSAVNASLAELKAATEKRPGEPRKVEPVAKVEPKVVEPRKIEPNAKAEPRAVEPHATEPRTTEVSASPRTGQSAYDAALKTYEKGDYTQAQAQFSAFLQSNPNHTLTPNALYWLGECYYSKGQYDTAIVNFKDVAGKYPKHAKSAAALLKAGFAYSKLNDKANAQFYWQMLVDDFPGTQPARIAQQRLTAK